MDSKFNIWKNILKEEYKADELSGEGNGKFFAKMENIKWIRYLGREMADLACKIGNKNTFFGRGWGTEIVAIDGGPIPPFSIHFSYFFLPLTDGNSSFSFTVMPPFWRSFALGSGKNAGKGQIEFGVGEWDSQKMHKMGKENVPKTFLGYKVGIIILDMGDDLRL
jgi:hypothetical protein